VSNTNPIPTGSAHIGEYKIDMYYDEQLGYVLTVSRNVNGRTLCVRSINSQYVESPEILQEVIKQAMHALDNEVKRTEIKEYMNPSFRRKDYDKQSQTI